MDPLSSWAAWYFSVLYTPLVLMLGEKGRTLDHGGAGWTGRISIDVSEQLGSLLKFVHLTSRINFRRPSDREHDLKKNHGPPEVPGFLCDFKFYIQVDEI